MTERGLPAEVRLLIAGPLTSMAHVEALLCLRRAAPTARTLAEIAAEIHAASAAAARRTLDDLVAGHLAQRGDGDSWRFAPRSAELARAVDALATMYNERPVTLIRAVYERPTSSPLQSFADAFRLRDRDPGSR